MPRREECAQDHVVLLRMVDAVPLEEFNFQRRKQDVTDAETAMHRRNHRRRLAVIGRAAIAGCIITAMASESTGLPMPGSPRTFTEVTDAMPRCR